MTLQIDNGDCLELMKKLPDKSVDLFICDLPYGETNGKKVLKWIWYGKNVIRQVDYNQETVL